MEDVFSTAAINPSKNKVRPEDISAMFHLPDNELMPLVLVAVCQHDYEKTAEILHTDIETVRSHTERARAHLQELISKGQTTLPAHAGEWRRDCMILTELEPDKEFARGMAILYAIAAGEWGVRMDQYNGKLLMALAPN